MAFVRVTGPDEEPVTLDEARAQCNVAGFTSDDALIGGLIPAARMHFERETNRSLVSQTWRLDLEHFPYPRGREPSPHFAFQLGFTGEPIRLRHGPVAAVESVKYYDFAGVQQTLDPAQYLTELTSDVAQISPLIYSPWPWAPTRFGAVSVAYTAGVADASAVDRLIKQGILMIIAHWYANRATVIAGDGRFAALEVPMASQSIIESYRIPVLG